MARWFLFAMVAAGCGGLASKDVTVDDSEKVSNAPSFGGISAAGFNSALTQQGINPTFIQSASLTSFSMMATSPQGSDLSFLQSGALWIETSSADKTEIASTPSFPAGQASVDFTVVPGVELKPYLTASSYQVILDLPLNRPPPLTGVQVDAKAVIHVTFKL